MINKKFRIISKELFPKIKYKNIQNPPFIIAFFGFPGSGKTYISKLLEERYKAIRINSDEIVKIIMEKKLAKNPRDGAKIKGYFIYSLIENMPFKNKRIILDKSIDREYSKLLKICKSNNFPYFFIRLKIKKRNAIRRLNERGIKDKELVKWMNKWNKEWELAEKKTKSHITLDGNKPDLKKLYSVLKRQLFFSQFP